MTQHFSCVDSIILNHFKVQQGIVSQNKSMIGFTSRSLVLTLMYLGIAILLNPAGTITNQTLITPAN